MITLALFCKVVDNYGDIGICYRLARQLTVEHNLSVTLWVDDLHSFHRLCPAVDCNLKHQRVQTIQVRHWTDTNDHDGVCDAADIVLEFFGCEIPAWYVAAMKARASQPVWINLEGLTAEAWVEGCHTLPSPQQSLAKYFFYPGFTARTGGLIIEAGLIGQCQQFQQDNPAVAGFLSQLGLTEAERSAIKVSLFCYPHAPVGELFDVWKTGNRAITCLVPDGVAPAATRAFFGTDAAPGMHATQGSLTVHILPFLPQPDFDRLLWACDINFVRGEDSFVRAQWASRPFIWHIYPQDNQLHHVKLRAFLSRCSALTAAQHDLMLAWNDVPGGTIDLAAAWENLLFDRQKIAKLLPEWQSTLLTNGDFSSNLLKFAATINPDIRPDTL